MDKNLSHLLYLNNKNYNLLIKINFLKRSDKHQKAQCLIKQGFQQSTQNLSNNLCTDKLSNFNTHLAALLHSHEIKRL